MIKILGIATMLVVFGLSQLAIAQDLPTAGKRSNIDYIEVVFVKYKSGMRGAAGRIVREKFMAASQAAETPMPITLHMQTGPWDAMLFWNNGDSMGNMDWFLDANGEKWWAAMAEQNGGIENARKIRADYDAMIARTITDIAHRHLPPPEEGN